MRLTSTVITRLLSLGVVGAAWLGAACEPFDPAPVVTLDGTEQGTMTGEVGDPLVIRLSEPVKRSTLRFSILRVDDGDVDGEGNLPDEPGYQGDGGRSREHLEAMTVVSFVDGAATGGTAELADTAITVNPATPLQVSKPYVVVVEPGLEDLAGNATTARIRLPFAYPLLGGGPTRLPSQKYFFLMNISFAGTQLQLFADLRVDATTGAWEGMFTEADRGREMNTRPGCTTSCPQPGASVAVACQLTNPDLDPCVAPSTKMTEIAQYTDFMPFPELPDGFTFHGTGFARDNADGTISFGTPPFNIDIMIGAGTRVTTEDTVLNGVFTQQQFAGAERWVATGQASVGNVILNGTPGPNPVPAEGDVSAISLTDADVTYAESFGTPIPTLDYVPSTPQE